MAHYTQKAILQTFQDMLEEMPFDQITVSAIVARCEISSNTFYYHYRDIYDLLDAWLAVQKDAVFSQSEGPDAWYRSLKAMLHKMQDHPKIVYHTFQSISRERLEQYIFNSVEESFYQPVKEQAEGMHLSDETLQVIAGFYCYSVLGFIIKFIWNHMDMDVDDSVDRLHTIFNGMLEHITHNLPAE